MTDPTPPEATPLADANRPRKWWIAFLLNFGMTGLGQIYNGDLRKGLLFFALSIGLMLVGCWIIMLTLPLAPLHLLLGLGPIYAFLLFAQIDAVQIARNRQSYTLSPCNRWYIYAFSLAAIVLLQPANISRKFGLQAYNIPSGAMEGALLVGDHLLATHLTYGPTVFSYRLPGLREPRPGDVIIFRSPVDEERDLIKRCVAVGGQKVKIVDKTLYVDGVAQALPPLAKHTDQTTYAAIANPRDNFGPYVVPEGHFFMLGDNRDNSADSRYWRAVPRELIKAQALTLYWSWDKKESRVRWGRIGDVIAHDPPGTTNTNED